MTAIPFQSAVTYVLLNFNAEVNFILEYESTTEVAVPHIGCTA